MISNVVSLSISSNVLNLTSLSRSMSVHSFIGWTAKPQTKFELRVQTLRLEEQSSKALIMIQLANKFHLKFVIKRLIDHLV